MGEGDGVQGAGGVSGAGNPESPEGLDGLDGLDGLSRLSLVHDPVRRSLYRLVAARHEPVSRDQAAEASGISRTLAAYHLDKLAAAGLLAVSYRRPEGRSGPGAGRPAKVYVATDQELAVHLPPRDYALLARLLATAIQDAGGDAVHAAIVRSAEATGRAMGRGSGTGVDALRRAGYLPQPSDDGVIELRNCPFHQVAREHRRTVCGLNLHLVTGIMAGAGDAAGVRLEPAPGRCCITLHPAAGEHGPAAG